MKKLTFITKNCSCYHNKTVGVFILLLMAMSLLFFTSCKKNNSDPVDNGGFTIMEETELDMDDIMDQLMLHPDDPDAFDYHDVINEIMRTAEEDSLPSCSFIKLKKVKYKSIDNKGNEIELSGLFIHPYFPVGTYKTPIISFNHGTQLQKKYAPSQYSFWKGKPLEFAEVLIALSMAFHYNWAIILPDYQGMGEDKTENHPYCVREKLGVATADMIKAARETIMPDQKKDVIWDGRIYLLGFSEGGFVTLAATQELEKRDETINGVACLDGPYDLAGTMLDVMLSNDPFPVPYFLPMFFVGFNTIYPESFVYNEMLKPPYNVKIPKYTDGFHTESEISAFMPSSGILKEVFTDNFIDTLKNYNSNAYKTLFKNNAYIDNKSNVWKPKSQMLFWHCKNDDCVPFGNFTKVKSEYGTVHNIEYVEWPPIDPIFEQTIHVSVAPRAFWEGAHWIYCKTKNKN